MAPFVLPGFKHHIGQHCGSTALVNAAAYRGLRLDEGTCFGLGGGLAFVYRHLPVSPYRAAMGRSSDLEEQFFANLGAPLTWQSGPELDLPQLLRQVADGNPVLVRLDLAHLEFYGTDTHFAGHAALLVGYDIETNDVFLSDTDKQGLQTLGWDSLRRSMGSDFPFPIPIQNHWAVIPVLSDPDLRQACRQALRLTVQNALEPAAEDMGMAALATFARELGNWWREVDDAPWTYRFAYQILERRGTGGGNFRRLFADFLRFAAATSPDLGLEGEAKRWLAVADRWTKLAGLFKSLSAAPSGAAPGADLLGQATATATDLVVEEGALLQDLARRIGY